MDNDYRKEMSKLGEELLLVEEERKAGKKVYTIDELDNILNEVIDNEKKGETTSSDLPEEKIFSS